ncbi:MAG: hypothetical protein HYR85_24365 [Planctomycetes bacterium]|nr:hypothetical protein [Planctomycetota bacterium]MBI3844348.1 hypothetical protein [Planctomycetota bacterium]
MNAFRLRTFSLIVLVAFPFHFPSVAAAQPTIDRVVRTDAPIVVVYGAADVDAQFRERTRADAVSRWLAAIRDGVSCEVRAARDVTEEILRSHNLVVLGTGRSNALLTKLQDRLPLRVGDGTLRFGDRDLEDPESGVVLVADSPFATNRVVFIVAGAEERGIDAALALLPTETDYRVVVGTDVVREGRFVRARDATIPVAVDSDSDRDLETERGRLLDGVRALSDLFVDRYRIAIELHPDIATADAAVALELRNASTRPIPFGAVKLFLGPSARPDALEIAGKPQRLATRTVPGIGSVLTADAAPAFGPGETVEVIVRYGLRHDVGPRRVGEIVAGGMQASPAFDLVSGEIRLLPESGWYPTPFPLAFAARTGRSGAAPILLRVSTNSDGDVAVSSGERVGDPDVARRTHTYLWKLSTPGLPVLIAGSFRTKASSRGGIDAIVPDDFADSEDAEESRIGTLLESMAEMRRFYSEKLGGGSASLRVVVASEASGAAAVAGDLILVDPAFLGAEGAARESALATEIARTWLGFGAFPVGPGLGVLADGAPTYLASRFVATKRGAAASAKFFDVLASAYETIARTDRPLAGLKPGDRSYRRSGATRGAWFLRALATDPAAVPLDAALAALGGDSRGRDVSLEMLREAFSRGVAGDDVDRIARAFHEWTEGTGVPDLSLDRDAEGVLRVRNRGAVSTAVTVEITAGTETRRIRVRVAAGADTALPPAPNVTAALLDPDHEVLDFDRSDDVWPGPAIPDRDVREFVKALDAAFLRGDVDFLDRVVDPGVPKKDRGAVLAPLAQIVAVLVRGKATAMHSEVERVTPNADGTLRVFVKAELALEKGAVKGEIVYRLRSLAKSAALAITAVERLKI